MVFEAIVEAIVEHTDHEASEVTMESTFADLGIDSLDTVELLMTVEDKVGTEIELEGKHETVGDLVKFIEEKYHL